ncbi:hypothetical protein K439DRAFT_1333614 [Ramaria rubella]|nr:hypothetical protein K439DRAFT_1333614 [Ramaria rubella]
MEFHLCKWLEFLCTFGYRHELANNDYVFSSVNTKCLSQPGTPISHDTVQKWLNEFVAGAGIKLGKSWLTTHCCRCGGAQYRFIYAPVGKCWTLAIVRWWGGWAKGEHVSNSL